MFQIAKQKHQSLLDFCRLFQSYACNLFARESKQGLMALTVNASIAPFAAHASPVAPGKTGAEYLFLNIIHGVTR